MKFISKSLFYFVKAEEIRSEFYGIQHRKYKGLANYREAYSSILSPESLFESLVKGAIRLDVMAVLTLMSWQDNLWVSSDGEIAMKNFWLSALNHKNEGNNTYYFMMILRVILSDAERYPAPTNVIQTMTNSLKELINQGYIKNNAVSINILKIFVDQTDSVSQEKSLAKLAFNRSSSVSSLMKDYDFPHKLPIVKNANFYWLKDYINSNFSLRKNLNASLNEILNSYKKVKDQQKVAKLIINESLFDQSPKELVKKIEDFPEFVHWLSICDRNKLFREQLTPNEIQHLNIWVGTGNYQSLSKLLVDITKYESLESSAENLTKNRYIFWENYQHLFRESWLLVSNSTYNNHPDIKNFKNVKILNGMSKPIILIRIGQYYLAQMFIEKGLGADFFMIDNSNAMEKLLNSPEVSYNSIKNLQICLIHDHLHLWQSDLAFNLDKFFNILPHGKMIKVTPYKNLNYLQEISVTIFASERKVSVKNWLKDAKYRWDSSTVSNAALTAKRYNLI